MRQLLIALLLACAACLAQAQTETPPPLQEFRQAEFLASESDVPPANDAAWQALELPDVWRISRPESELETAWYRIRFQALPLENILQAVYLPKLIMNARVYLNGVLIGDGGQFEEPVSRNWNRPLIFLLPPGLLRAGENTLHIRLRAHAYTQAALHPISVGPEFELRDLYERSHFLKITVNQTASLLISAIGILMLTLWLRRRQDTAYAYFSAAALT